MLLNQELLAPVFIGLEAKNILEKAKYKLENAQNIKI